MSDYTISKIITSLLLVAILVTLPIYYGTKLWRKLRDISMNKNLSGKYIDNNDIELWTETFGSRQNPAILLIAGAMAPARFWSDEFCNYLANQDYFVIRYDHRDTGLSTSIDYTQSPYTMDDLIKDAIVILDAYGIKKAHLVGHSLGGMLVQLLALKHPDRCLSITVISDGLLRGLPLTDEEKEIQKKSWDILLENKPTLVYAKSLDGFLRSYKLLNGTVEFDETMAKAYIKDMYERSKHMYLTKENQIKAFEVPHNHVRVQENLNIKEKDLQKIAIPTLIIHGQKDYLAMPSLAKATAHAIPGSKLVIIPEMGHMIFNHDLEQKIGNLLRNHIQATKKRKS